MLDEKLFKRMVDLRPYTTIHIGGKAKYLAVADNIGQLYSMYSECITHNIGYKVIGLGANLIFDDRGYNGAIIVNRACKIFKRKTSLYIDSGTPINTILSYTYKHGLSGIENLAGIPATMGGAIVNNLGSNGCEISKFVDYVLCLDEHGKLVKLTKNQCNFNYRDSIFKHEEYIILRVKLTLLHEDRQIIKQNISTAINKKVATQPLNQPSAGSVFKRCKIIPSLEIDKLGLKGTKIGGAMISTKHAGFIVNTGNATSKDFKELVNYIQNIVQKNYGIQLKLEIEIVE